VGDARKYVLKVDFDHRILPREEVRGGLPYGEYRVMIDRADILAGTREAQMLVAYRRCDDHDLHPHSSLGTKRHRSSPQADPTLRSLPVLADVAWL
jgi:hypothetical protein